MIVAGHDYAVRPLTLTAQFSLAAKLAPIVAIMSLQGDRAVLKKNFPRSFAALCQTMPVEEQEWVLNTCLGVVSRCDVGVPPAPVWVGGMPAFQDIDMRVMLELVWEVIEAHKLVDFFSADPSASSAGQDSQSSGSGSRTIG